MASKELVFAEQYKVSEQLSIAEQATLSNGLTCGVNATTTVLPKDLLRFSNPFLSKTCPQDDAVRFIHTARQSTQQCLCCTQSATQLLYSNGTLYAYGFLRAPPPAGNQVRGR